MAQALALVVVTAIAAQLITFAVLLNMPSPREVFTFDDVAEAMRRRAPIEREGQILSVRTVEAPPSGWEEDSRLELQAQTTLARVLGAPVEDVLIEHDPPMPGGVWVMRLRSPPVSEPAPPVLPFARGGAACVRLVIGCAESVVRTALGADGLASSRSCTCSRPHRPAPAKAAHRG